MDFKNDIESLEKSSKIIEGMRYQTKEDFKASYTDYLQIVNRWIVLVSIHLEDYQTSALTQNLEQLEKLKSELEFKLKNL